MGQPWPVLLMVRELGIGGSERQLTETARLLDRTRFQPHVACFRAPGLRRGELEAAGVPICPLSVRSLYRASAVRGALELRSYLRAHRIQLVHTFDTPSNLFGVPVARAWGTPVVLSSQRAHRELTAPAIRRLLRVTDRIAQGIVVNCQFLADHLIHDEGVPAARVHLCYNSVDPRAFHPEPRVRQHPLAGAELVVGTVCALREEKRLDLLLSAFAAIAAPGRKLVIVGSGPMRSALEEQCRRLSLEPYCHFEPATTEVGSWLRSIDVFVLPSRTEGLSNSLMEAMACGCAVVASDVGGNPELVGHGETGLLFTSGDAASLTARLRQIAEDGRLRQEMGSRAASLVRQRFQPGVSMRRMEQIYEEALSAAVR